MGLWARRLGLWAAHLFFGLVVLAVGLWAGTAAWVQLPEPWRSLAWGLIAVAALAVLTFRFRHGRLKGWYGLGAVALVVAAIYSTIQPSQSRDWAPDVAHGVTGQITGTTISLQNVRDFDWTSASEAQEHWEDRSYDLAQLNSVDVLTSTWGNPDIAHLIVSFGFADGRHLAFSVEIRKERGEAFSTIGGFFRAFELVLIAADEEDVVRVRTNQRGETVHLFPVALRPDQREALLRAYIDLGNRLAAKPAFYNTVTDNCTSSVYRLVLGFKPDVPLDTRLLFSGKLPDFIGDLGGLYGHLPMDERRAKADITARARAIPEGEAFSPWIRRGSNAP